MCIEALGPHWPLPARPYGNADQYLGEQMRIEKLFLRINLTLLPKNAIFLKKFLKLTTPNYIKHLLSQEAY
ncbi:MAG: hypothetical protein AAFU64_10855, partial [Bacteroidota bacterium]